MSLKKLSPLLVVASFGALGAFHDLEKPVRPELLPIVPSVQNSQIRLVPQTPLPGESNPIGWEVFLEFETEGTQQVVRIDVEDEYSVTVGDVSTDSEEGTWETIEIDSGTSPNVYLSGEGYPRKPINDYTWYGSIQDGSDQNPFGQTHVAVRETSDGYELHILYQNSNGIKIDIKP